MTKANPSGKSGSRMPGWDALACLCAIGMMTAALPGNVAAQGLRDPTRPPAQFLDPADATQAAMLPDSGLQSIKRTGKRYLALLNGEWVKPGDKAGEATVVKIAEHSLVLSYPDGRRETIGMYPDIEMRPKEVQSRPRKAAGRTAGR